MQKRLLKRLFNLILAVCMAAGLFMGTVTVSKAAEFYTVTASPGVLLTGEGAEVFSDADASTLVTTMAGNQPVEVIATTSNGFYQVKINGQIFYMYQGGLSMQAATTAYKLTSMNAKAALVGDATTGRLIYSQDALKRLAPASTTKLMTALPVMDNLYTGKYDLTTPVAVSATALSGIKSDASHVTPRLQLGEVMTVEQLLKCMLISSDCHASNVLAELVAGSVDAFVAQMNVRAAAMGCTDTNFVNAHGYPASKHYTNAYSLFLIAQAAFQYPVFQQIISIAKETIPATNLSPTRNLVNTNALITPSNYTNAECLGGKTGTASSAGDCLVAYGRRNGKTVISVVLGAKTITMTDGTRVNNRYYETNRLLDIGLSAK